MTSQGPGGGAWQRDSASTRAGSGQGSPKENPAPARRGLPPGNLRRG